MAPIPSLNQQTLKDTCQISGVCLHSGLESKVVLRPAPVDTGFTFFQNGKKVWSNQELLEGIGLPETFRCTAVGHEPNQIHTVEHLVASLYAMGVTNVSLDVSGSEVPGLDGSAADWVRLLDAVGYQDQKKARQLFLIREPIFIGEPKKFLTMVPDTGFSIAYTLDYEHSFLKNQQVDFEVTPDQFRAHIAPARTFCTEDDWARAKATGLGLGATRQNTLVFTQSGLLDQTLRLPHECATHKVLDILGDVGLLGVALRGRIVGLRSGHEMNRKLCQKIVEQMRG